MAFTVYALFYCQVINIKGEQISKETKNKFCKCELPIFPFSLLFPYLVSVSQKFFIFSSELFLYLSYILQLNVFVLWLLPSSIECGNCINSFSSPFVIPCSQKPVINLFYKVYSSPLFRWVFKSSGSSALLAFRSSNCFLICFRMKVRLFNNSLPQA